MQHALQRKEPARRKEKDGKKKKLNAAKKRALANKARKLLAPRKAVAAVKESRKATNGAKSTAVARFRLNKKQPVEEVKKPRPSPAAAQPRPAAEQVPVFPAPSVYKIKRSVERGIELWQVRNGKKACIQVTAPMAGDRQLAIQWIEILKEVLDEGGTQAEARTVKEWLKNGTLGVAQLDTAQILRSVRAVPAATG